MRGPSLFAAREARPRVQPRQPPPIQPNWRLEEYLQGHAAHVAEQEQQHMRSAPAAESRAKGLAHEQRSEQRGGHGVVRGRRRAARPE